MCVWLQLCIIERPHAGNHVASCNPFLFCTPMAHSSIPPQQQRKLSEGMQEPESIRLSSADAVVHLEYDDPKNLLSLKETTQEHDKSQDEPWTRFVCISDTHSKLFEVPDGDVLLHAGDLTTWGHKDDMEKVVDWLCGMRHKVKMYVHRLEPSIQSSKNKRSLAPTMQSHSR